MLANMWDVKVKRKTEKGGKPGEPSYKHAVRVDKINDDAQFKRRLKSGMRERGR